MRYFALLLALSLTLYANTIEGVGYGLTKDAAIEQAKRDAVEIGLGAYISSETVVTATSLTDNIYSKAQGFVKTFKVISENKGPDGNWEVTISAEVTAILDEVMQDEAALQTLLSSMNRPRIIFMIREINLVDNIPTTFAETKLLSMFFEKGFDVVDRQMVQALKGEPDYEDALSGNVSAAAKIASQLGAEVIVIGETKISLGGVFFGTTSVNSTMSVKIIKTDTGAILAVANATGKSTDTSASLAATNSVIHEEEYWPNGKPKDRRLGSATILGREIIRQLIEKWSTAQSNFVKCYIVLKNADFMSYTMFETFLKAQTVSGIRNAYSKSLNDGIAEYEIEFEGKAMDLAMGLSKTQPDGFNIKVTGITGNRITAEITQ
jgi:hypothetical protein